MSTYYVREEDGTSRYTLEDDTGYLLHEGNIGSLEVPFITAATTVYAPEGIWYGRPLFAPFIAATTTLYTPAVSGPMHPAFITATTTLYTHTIRRAGVPVPHITDTHVFTPRIVRPLSNTVAPSIIGTARVGQQLEADPGVWSGTEPIVYSYQWRRCDAAGASCSDITGATGRTYIVVSADVGNTLRVRVTASDS